MAHFDHEKLRVYETALDFVALSWEIARKFPTGRSHLGDQLHRAALSVALNIAEGAGEFSGREKARFYRMAKRSTTECAAILDVASRLELTDAAQSENGRDLLFNIAAMLTRMIRNRTLGKQVAKRGSALDR